MSRDFIELYDDDGYRYIVNMDKISFVNVAGRKVWAGEGPRSQYAMRTWSVF